MPTHLGGASKEENDTLRRHQHRLLLCRTFVRIVAHLRSSPWELVHVRLTSPPPQHLVVEVVKAWSTSPRRACRGQIRPCIPHLPWLEPPCSSKRSPPRSSAARPLLEKGL